MTDPAVIAALISGSFALLSVIASIVVAKWQIDLQNKDLQLKSKEIETTAEYLKSELESLRQLQFNEVLRKRIDNYPKLWATALKYTINWEIERKARDAKWAEEFLTALNQCNLETGVFFSQAVHERFHELRTVLVQLEFKLSNGESVSQTQLKAPDAILKGSTNVPGLATYLKDDLGSYRATAIQTRIQ